MVGKSKQFVAGVRGGGGQGHASFVVRILVVCIKLFIAIMNV
jgi:hypothetical protein